MPTAHYPILRTVLIAVILCPINCLVSCNRGFDLVPDPQEVVEIPGYNGEGTLQPIKINNLNQIIGYTGSGEPPLYSLSYSDLEIGGFLINSDGSGFLDLRGEDQLFNWPFDLTDEGHIVGAFTPQGNYTGEYVPAYAYSMQADGSAFKNLHPEGAFYSIARQVSSTGVIVGEYGRTGNESIACLFRGDSIVELVNPAVQSYSKIHSANDHVAIVYAGLGDNRYAYYQFDFETELLTRMDISEEIANFSGLYDLTDDGLAVGFYIDLNVSELAIGMTYHLQTKELLTYQAKNKQGKSEYLEYTFFGVNTAGLLVGRSGRDYASGLLQSRAMKMNGDFTGFRDITPENSDIYSELHSVNDAGLAVGYLGLPRKRAAVVNKMFVIRL